MGGARMFLRLKICTTVLFLYEIIAVILLHLPNTCATLFGLPFCSDAVYKYFIVCAAVPMIAFLIAMWIRQIVVAHRRRHSVLRRARGAVRAIAENVRDHVAGHISQPDMEKMIAAALMMGVKRYARRHGNIRRWLDEINNPNYYADASDFDDMEYDDDEYDDDDRNAPRRNYRPRHDR